MGAKTVNIELVEGKLPAWFMEGEIHVTVIEVAIVTGRDERTAEREGLPLIEDGYDLARAWAGVVLDVRVAFEMHGKPYTRRFHWLVQAQLPGELVVSEHKRLDTALRVALRMNTLPEPTPPVAIDEAREQQPRTPAAPPKKGSAAALAGALLSLLDDDDAEAA